MKMSLRNGMCAGAAAVGLAAWCFLSIPSLPAADEAAAKVAAKPGQLSDAQLGASLKAIGIQTQKVDSRYDFLHKAIVNKEEWNLSMTAVLSQDGSAIWFMAWLDQLPRSQADVPRTALLRLLSDNDRLGNGKFFAYVATNRRFVLQRVVPNEGVDAKKLKGWLDDLGTSVVDTYEHWSVAAWKAGPDASSTAKSSEGADDDAPAGRANGQPNFSGAGQNPVRTAQPSKAGSIRN